MCYLNVLFAFLAGIIVIYNIGPTVYNNKHIFKIVDYSYPGSHASELDFYY